ncbi:unnamed protein product [Wuchereria bancrofti]|nr:unnamed protein product [Wuchereria bancrofti]
MDDPTISKIQSSFMLSTCSLRRPSGDEEITTATTRTETIPIESAPDIDQNEAPDLLSELNTESNTNDKEMPVEKRLKFQLSNKESSELVADRANDMCPKKPKPKRKIMRRVCEAGSL